MNRKYTYPIKIVFLFNIFTIFLFIVGPWQFTSDNKGLVVTFVVICNVTMYVGYRFKISRSATLNCASERNLDNSTWENVRLLKIWGYIGLVLSIPDFLYTTRIFTLSPSLILQRIVMGFTNSYENYAASLGYVNSGSAGESLFVIANVLLYFFKFAILPLSIIYWKKITRSQKIICVFVTVLEILKWIVKGMNKGLFDFVIITFVSFMIYIFSTSGERLAVKRRERKQMRRVYTVVGILVAIAITMFTMNSISRSQNTNISYYSPTTGFKADPDNWILRLFPSFMTRAVLSFSMYLTEGYYGLSVALKLPYVFNSFVGHSMFLLTNFQDILGINIWNRTYMVRISEVAHWDSKVNWHSLYSWIANDVPFIFIPLVFFVIGAVFAAAWRDAIKYRNPYAILVVVLFFIEFFYTSANNQIGALAYTSMAWYISLFFWRINSKKYRRIYFADNE